jgi:hypothetical protein
VVLTYHRRFMAGCRCLYGGLAVADWHKPLSDSSAGGSQPVRHAERPFPSLGASGDAADKALLAFMRPGSLCPEGRSLQQPEAPGARTALWFSVYVPQEFAADRGVTMAVNVLAVTLESEIV